MVDFAARRAQRRDVRAHLETHAGPLAELGQLAHEQVGIARFVLGRVGGPRQLRADVAQRRFDAHRLVGADDLALAAQLAHLFGRAERAVEFLGVGIEMQDALRALVVLDAGVAAQLLQRAAAVGAQADDLPDVVARALGRAVAQEGQPPEPLAHIGTQAEQQRCVLLAQPLQHLERCARVGPGLGVADRDLAAVGETGFRAGRGLAVDDGHFVTLLLEVVGRGHAEQAGAEDDHAHFESLLRFWRLSGAREQLCF